MDTTPPPLDTIASSRVENLGNIQNKDAEMSQLEQNTTEDCNNMNINKRARQRSGRRSNVLTAGAHRSSAVASFGMAGGGVNTGVVSRTDPSDLRDHRMSVSDSGDSEPPRSSDLDSETMSAATVHESVSPPGTSVVSPTNALESDGDVRTDDDDDDEL